MWSRRLSEEQVIGVRFTVPAPFISKEIQGKLLMSWFVYIVECRDESFYTGITWNLKKRIAEHNQHIKTSLQFSKLPVRLVYWERFKNRFEAARKEKEIKGWTRAKKQKLVDSLHETT